MPHHSYGGSLDVKLQSYPFIAPEQYAGKLDGKVTIITGASVGLGRDLVKAFANAGANVAAVARRETELNSLVEEVTKAGGKAFAIVADVLAPGAVKKIVSETESKFGPIDILINNAGIVRLSNLDAEPEDIEKWWRVHELNVKAPVQLVRAVLPGMLERKSGILITISSGVLSMQLPVMTAYASSKAAITKFHESLSLELQGTGILSFSLTPGIVRTELGAQPDALNKQALENPFVKGFLESIKSAGGESQDPDVMANVALAMCADERYKPLNGRFIVAANDVEPVVAEANKEGLGRIGKEDLYYVRTREL